MGFQNDGLASASVEGDDCASITPPSEATQASGSNAANSRNIKKSRIGSVFKAWQFHFMIKTDLRYGTTAADKEKLLTEHLSARTGHARPLSIIGMVVFCDPSLFSQPRDSDGLFLIELFGYVQAKNATP
jgi:hypothetical protein